MANDNNSSAPLKTAEGAVHPHLIALRTIAEYPITAPMMNIDAANMQRIAAQAVAAQAAPAAPDTNRLRAEILEHASKGSRLVRTLFNEPTGTLSDVEVGDWIQRAQQYLRFATPAPPATGDSSADDLADPDARAKVTLALGLGAGPRKFSWSYLLGQISELVKCEQELTLLKVGVKRSKAQAEVQAEPVLCYLKVAATIIPGGGYQVCFPKDRGAFPVYAAPQAQPADALDAAARE